MEPLVTAGRIRACRKKKGLTQTDLGRELGVTASAIMRYELGQRKISVDTVQRIAEILDVPVGYLLCDTDSLDGKLNTPWAEMVIGSDDSLGNRIATAFLSLNIHGQEKAVERVEELTEIPKYQKTDDADMDDWILQIPRYRAQTAPQSTPPPSEGQSTTPPPDTPETPPEGE